MRRLIITLDGELDLWMAGQVNQSETARKALMLYKGDITTEVDTLDGLRKSYIGLKNYMETKFEYYDHCFAQLEKLINVLETRM